MTRLDIQEYFDIHGVDRDEWISSNPLIAYESAQRAKAVFELLQPAAGDVILDVGCGNARDIRGFLNYACYSVGVDISAGMLLDGKRRVSRHSGPGTADLMKSDALVLPFPDNVFDKVVSSEVIEHIPNWRAAVAEMARVLKPGGRIAITTPNSEGIYSLWHRTVDRGARWVKTRMGRTNHPYDEWKRQQDVLAVLAEHHCQPIDLLGMCYYPLPPLIGYKLPAPLAAMTIAPVRGMEPLLRRRFHRFGYMMGIGAQKQ